MAEDHLRNVDDRSNNNGDNSISYDEWPLLVPRFVDDDWKMAAWYFSLHTTQIL